MSVEQIENIKIFGSGQKQYYEGEALTEELASLLLKQTYDGLWQRIEINYKLQDAGTYVRRLKRKVFQTFRSTLVLHYDNEKRACIFFSGETMSCFAPIFDFYVYCNVSTNELIDTEIGGAMLPEYLIDYVGERTERGLKYFLKDIKNAESRLKKSEMWMTEINLFGGRVRYDKQRREWGLIDDAV